VDGEVRVTAGGQEIARLGPGGYVGEIGLLRDVPGQASLTAVTNTRLLALDREPFLEAVTGSTRAAAVAHGGIEQRLAELEPGDRNGAPIALQLRTPLGLGLPGRCREAVARSDHRAERPPGLGRRNG
jgi:Cyclic nucleotide-binding domain